MAKAKSYNCIYCLNSKAAPEFDREHVMPEAFGRFKNSPVLKYAVCKDCNSHFGETIDRALARGSMQGVIRYFRGLKPLREFNRVDHTRVRLSAQAPGQKNFQEAEIVRTNEGEGLAFKPGFAFRSVSTGKERFVSLETLEHGSWHEAGDIDREELALIRYRDEDTLVRLKKALEKLRLRLDILDTWREAEPGQRILVAIDAPREDEALRRAIAKIAFNYLAFFKGSEFVRKGIFDEIRSFIRYGSPISKLCVSRTNSLRLYGHTEEAKRRAGHVLELDLAPKGLGIVGFVEFFGIMTYQVELGAFENLIEPISSGHYYDLGSKQVLRMDAVRRPPELLIPK